MALEVIGAGFGRTGTKSLKVALEILGFEKCHHMVEVISNKRQIHFWERASRSEVMDWDEVFSGYRAAVDWPSSAFYKELAEFYPNAKVVLGVRKPDAWYQSVSETIYSIGVVTPAWMSRFSKDAGILSKVVNRVVWQGIFDNNFENKEHSVQVFKNHIEEVKRNIPTERLLVHEASEGWKPLCEFLEKPIPDVPYPRVNEAKELKRAVLALRCLGKLPWVLASALCLWLIVEFVF